MLDIELSERSPLQPHAHTYQNSRERKNSSLFFHLVGTKWHEFSGEKNHQKAKKSSSRFKQQFKQTDETW